MFHDNLFEAQKQGAFDDSFNMDDVPSYQEHIEEMANANDSIKLSIGVGYIDDTPKEKISEKIKELFFDDYKISYRSGPYSDSTYFIPRGKDPKCEEYIYDAIKDANERYFSDESSSDKRRDMETILKKMRFKKDIIEAVNPDLMELYFYRSGSYYNTPEEYGLPPELKTYSFNLSDSELALLATAEEEDFLANAVKMSMPPSIQEKILEKMPDEKYKKVVLENLNGAEENAESVIDSSFSERTIVECEEKRKQIASVKSIVEKLEDRDAIKVAASLVDVDIYCYPKQREHVGVQRYGGKRGIIL